MPGLWQTGQTARVRVCTLRHSPAGDDDADTLHGLAGLPDPHAHDRGSTDRVSAHALD